MRVVSILFLVLFLSPCGWAQEATTNHNAILRRDPSTSSPAIEHLQQGARLTLVDTSTTSGFYHVRTEDDQVGWVFAKFVSLSPPRVPVLAAIAPGTGPQCDSSISAHVYHPNRLIVKQECIAVTGTIVDATASQSKHERDGVRHEKDGDTHGWLKLDPGQESLLNAARCPSRVPRLYGCDSYTARWFACKHRRTIRARYFPCEVDGDTSGHEHRRNSLNVSAPTAKLVQIMGGAQ